MTLIYSAIAVLIGSSFLAAFFVVGRQVLRGYVGRRVLRQSGEVRSLLTGLRERNYVGINKMLFDMRDTFDMGVIEDELRALLGESKNGDKLRGAFELLGLTERYLERVAKASSWQERARCATALGQLGDRKAVGPLVKVMRDKREDSDVKLAAAEALGRIRDLEILPMLCEQLADIDEWASPRISKVLVSFGSDAVEPLLETIASNDSLNARVWGAQVLGKLRDRKATMPLVHRLHDRSEQMRMVVSNALGDIGDNRALRPLIEIILRDPVAAVRAQAASALGRIGDEGALPLLVTALGDPEYWMRFRALEAIEALQPTDTSPIEVALNDNNPEVRKRAALALERLGALEIAFENLPSEDPRLESEARARLIAVGRAGLSERLARHLDDENPFMRERIASLLGPVGNSGLAKDLVKRLDDDNELVQFSAIESLGDLAAEVSTASLVALISDSNPDRRREAVKALVRFPSDLLAKEIEAITAAVEDEADEIRTAAVKVVAIVDGEVVETMLIEALQDRYVAVRLAAVRALGQRQVESAVPALGLCLTDSYEKMRTEAATSLGKIGGQAAIDLLINIMPQASGEQRDSICGTLASLGFDAVRPILDVLMASSDIKTRLGAIWTLGKTADPRAARLLRLLLQEDDNLLRSSAAGALGKISCPESLEGLEEGVRDPSPYVRSAAINGLGRIGTHSNLETLIGCLDDPDAFVRNRSAVAIGRLGGEQAYRAIKAADADSIAPAMRVIAIGLTGSSTGIGEPLKAMKDPTLRHKVSDALEREEESIRVIFFSNLTPRPALQAPTSEVGGVDLDPAQLAQKFVDALGKSQSSDTRRRAASALSSMHDEEAIAALSLALGHDPDPEVRRLAAEGLAHQRDKGAAQGALIKAIVDPEPNVRMQAIEAVGHFAEAEQAKPIFESLRSSNKALVQASEISLSRVFAGPVEAVHDWMMGQESARMQSSGLRILRRIGDARSLGLIRALLRADEPEVRVEAARALAALQIPDAIRAMLDALGDPVELVRVGIVSALQGTTRADVVERLEQVRFDPSVNVRSQLADTLSTLNSSKALDILEGLAADTNPVVAGRSLVGLLSSPDNEGQHKLLRVLPDATPDATRVLRQDCESAVDSLREQLSGSLDAGLRELAVNVLAAIDSTRFAADIAEALDDPDAKVRLAAVTHLAELEPERIGDWLKKVLDDPVSEVRDAAKRALFKIV